MGSEEGIENVSRRIERANRLGIDLTNDWYELYLRAKRYNKRKKLHSRYKEKLNQQIENIETYTNNLQNNKMRRIIRNKPNSKITII